MCSYPLPDFGMTVIYFGKKSTCRLLPWPAFILLNSSGLVNEFLKWVRYRRWPQQRAAFSQSTNGEYRRPGTKHMPPPNTPHWVEWQSWKVVLTPVSKIFVYRESLLVTAFGGCQSRREGGELPPVFRELPGKMIVSLFFDKPNFIWFDFIGSNRFTDLCKVRQWSGDSEVEKSGFIFSYGCNSLFASSSACGRVQPH